MASAKLVRFGQRVNAGDEYGAAARSAGYAESTVNDRLADIVARAVSDGLIVDPEAVRADAAALSQASTDAAALFGSEVRGAAKVIVEMAMGKIDAEKTRLAAAIYIVNQVIGAPRQSTDITSNGLPIGAIPITEAVVMRPAGADE